jgi:hypothetical protein
MFTLSESVKKTLDMLRAGEIELAKATFNAPGSSTTGLQAYNLEAPAKTLVPRWTPLRNSIPRIGGGFAIQANWKAVTAIDAANGPVGVPEGTRNSAIAVTTADYNAVFKTFSVEASATFQAQWAGKNFEDIQARARQSGLHKFFVGEERVMLGGNTTSTGIALGTPTAPTGVGSASGGTMTARTVVGRVVALTLDGWITANANGLVTGVPTQTTITPADGSTNYTVNRGSSNKSAASGNNVLSGGTSSITWTWPDVRGAVGYALYTGVAAGERLAALVPCNKYVQTADEGAGNQTAASITADNSQNAYDYDGLLTQVIKSGNNAYYKTLDGATLTADTRGGVTEINDALVDRFVNYKVSTFDIYVSPKMMENIGKKIRTGSAVTPFTINVADGAANIVGGGRAIAYIHPITGEQLKFVPHPDLPDGVIVFKLLEAGPLYMDDRIPNVWQMLMRQDYFSIEWPLRTFRYEIAVTNDGVLQGYFPAGNAIIVNAALG